MRRGAVSAIAVSTAMLAGCASDWQRSYDRWYRYKAEAGPFARWASCIEHRAGFHLDPRTPDGLDIRQDMLPGNRSQLFTRVLGDCSELMVGPAWEALSEVDRIELLADAYRAFVNVDADIQAQMTAAIIQTAN